MARKRHRVRPAEWKLLTEPAKAFQDFAAVAAGQEQVKEHGGRRPRVDRLPDPLAVVEGGDRVAPFLKVLGEERPVDLLVLDDEYVRR